MSMHEALVRAMHLPADSDTARHLQEAGLAVANVDTMSQAVHDVFCGITTDHEHPNDKDRRQAEALVKALQERTATSA
jgi:hypothetical protein